MIHSLRRSLPIVLASSLLCAASGYNAVILHGPGVPFPFSYGWGAGGGQQVGHSNNFLTGGSHALLWSGSAGSLIDLHPAGFDNSYALAAEGGRQVGHVELENPFRQRAAMWSGSAASFVNLHVPGYRSTALMGLGGNQQVGYAVPMTGSRFPMLWRGTPESAILLSQFSGEANDTDGFQQVGAVTFGGPFHAALWTGTPESFVDLNPPGASSSWAYSVAKGQQVGHAGSGLSHAALWFGTAESHVDLDPGTGGGSKLYGTNGLQQVGQVVIPTVGTHAGVWSGTAGSFIDLHQFLPPGFHGPGQGEWSEARGIDEFGNIVGWARELGPNGGHRAVM